MPDYKKYKNYNELEFINDPFFQDFMLVPTAESVEFWRRFVEVYPEKMIAVESAKAFLWQLEFTDIEPNDAIVQDSLAKHLACISSYNDEKVYQVKRTGWWKVALAAAAAVVGIILIYTALFKNASERITVSTEFGKTDTVTLPDRSIVILNANSSIEYKTALNHEKRREIWLKGEAFFDVKHFNTNTGNIKPGEQFVVHTKDVDIEVLGTMFNIRQRRGRTEIVLQSGRIKVVFKDKETAPVLMTPGKIVIYNPLKNQISEAPIDAEKYTAWKEKNLILNNPTVNEIINYLEDNFGKQIILQKPEMGLVKIDGPIRLDNFDDAMFILSTVLSSEVKEVNNTFIIKPR